MQRSLILTLVMVVAVAGLAATGLVAVSGSAAAQEEVNVEDTVVIAEVEQGAFAAALSVARHGYATITADRQGFRDGYFGK